MEFPLITVIIPVYNTAPYLRRCLDSLLAQNFTDWEAVCINDGSTDDSLSILREYADDDARFVVIHQENAGAAAARNQGLAVARGEYLTLLDADDWFSPEALSVFHRVIQNSEADLVCTAFMEHRVGMPAKVCLSVPEAVMAVNHRSLSYVSYSGWSKLYRREIVKTNALKFQEGMKLGEDVLFVFQYLAHCRKLAMVPEPIYNYYRCDTSAVQQGIEGRYPLEVYYANMRVPLSASDYMKKVITQRQLRKEYNLFFWSQALGERMIWGRNTAALPALNRKLMRRDLRYVLVLAWRTASLLAWYRTLLNVTYPMRHRVKNFLRTLLHKE